MTDEIEIEVSGAPPEADASEAKEISIFLPFVPNSSKRNMLLSFNGMKTGLISTQRVRTSNSNLRGRDLF